MSGAIPPLPQYAFMAWCLVKHRDNRSTCQFLEKLISSDLPHLYFPIDPFTRNSFNWMYKNLITLSPIIIGTGSKSECF
jgi:hypothetical protein